MKSEREDDKKVGFSAVEECMLGEAELTLVLLTADCGQVDRLIPVFLSFFLPVSLRCTKVTVQVSHQVLFLQQGELSFSICHRVLEHEHGSDLLILIAIRVTGH